MRLAIPLASTLFAAAPALAAYYLVKEYSGTNFFDGWEFYGNYDNLTNGTCLMIKMLKTGGGNIFQVMSHMSTRRMRHRPNSHT